MRWRPSVARRPRSTNTDGILNSTISFFYGQAPRTELFQGYVVSVTVSSAGKGALSFSLLLLGPTKVMQIGQPRFWVNKTVPSAVKDIANSNLLGVTAHAHDLRLEDPGADRGVRPGR